MKKKLKNKIALITGGSRGIGFAIAKKYLLNGSSLILISRSKDELSKAHDLLNAYKADSNQKIYSYNVDLSLLEEVKIFCEKHLTKYKLDILVNCAGIVGEYGEIHIENINTFQKTFNVNLISPIILCSYISKDFKNEKYGKIINISGGGSTSQLPELNMYSLSKTSLVRYTENLSEQLKEYNVDVNALAPGAVMTDMNKKILESDPNKVGKNYHKKLKELLSNGGADPDVAAELAVFLASRDSDGLSGKLISAVWDNWRELDINKIMISDIYNLRRIVPSDRKIK